MSSDPTLEFVDLNVESECLLQAAVFSLHTDEGKKKCAIEMLI